jgi:membrane-associated phospholipid phosphatase
LLGGGLILAIALSRVLLGAHTTLDVLIGLAIGGAALAAIGPACLRAKSEAGGIATVFVAIALALLVLHGRSISFERVWRSSGAYLQDRTGLCRP